MYPINTIIDTQQHSEKGQTTCMRYMCKLSIAYWGGRELGVRINWSCIRRYNKQGAYLSVIIDHNPLYEQDPISGLATKLNTREGERGSS